MNIIDLETEVNQTCAMLSLFGERVVRDTEERGGRNSGDIAAGLMALQLNQINALVEKFHAALDEIREEASHVRH